MYINGRVFVLCFLLHYINAMDVLMMIGGQFFNATSQEFQILKQVEVIGPTKSCQIGDLPEPLYGMTAAKVGQTVLACGGFGRYYRSGCYSYSPRTDSWQLSQVSLHAASGYPSSTSVGDVMYVGGGRGYRHDRPEEPWEYYNILRKYDGRTRKWSILPNLTSPMADTCLLFTNVNGNRLWRIGGSEFPHRYTDEVFSLDIDGSDADWKAMPKMNGRRMWHVCSTAVIDDEIGIVVAGGYFNGVSSMWLPLADTHGRSLEVYGPNRNLPKWEWLSSLSQGPDGRKWGPGMGYVGKKLVIAGGGNYGCDTMDVLEGRDWRLSDVKMKFKREFVASATVPSTWFPQCNF